MSPDIKKAKEYFEKIEQGVKEFSSIPDKGLQQKIKKTGESAIEVVKHIEERTSPKSG